jgi:DNA replication protein DnaC
MRRKEDEELELLLQKLKWLKLAGMTEHLEALLAKAAKDNLTIPEILHRLCDEEKQSRVRRAVERRIKSAHFPEINTVDGFDFDFDAGRKKLRARYLALHDLGFLGTGINPLFIGVPGTGKTFLARALAYRACQAMKRVVFVSAPRMLNDLHGAELHGALESALRKYTHADFLVVDDFAVLAMDPAQAKLAFQVISERYDYRRATAITTNRPFKDWLKVFPDPLNAEVIAKRLTERSERFIFDGKGYALTNT